MNEKLRKFLAPLAILILLLIHSGFAQLTSGISNTVSDTTSGTILEGVDSGITSPPANQEYNCNDTSVNIGDYWTPTPGTSSYATCEVVGYNLCGLHICDANINPNHQRLKDGVVKKIIPDSGVLGIGAINPAGLTPALYVPETSTYLTLRYFSLPNVPLYGKGASYTTIQSTTISSVGAEEAATVDMKNSISKNPGTMIGSSTLKVKDSTFESSQTFTDQSKGEFIGSSFATLHLAKSAFIESKNTDIGNLNLESNIDNTKLIIRSLKPGIQSLPLQDDLGSVSLPTTVPQVIPQYSVGSTNDPFNLNSHTGGLTFSADGGHITGSINLISIAEPSIVSLADGEVRIVNHIRQCSYINGLTILGKDTLTVVASDDDCSQRTIENLEMRDNAIVQFRDESTLSDISTILAPHVSAILQENYRKTRVNNAIVKSTASGVLIKGAVQFENPVVIESGASVRRSFPIYITVEQANVKLPLVIQPDLVKVRKKSDNSVVCESVDNVVSVASGGAYIETCDLSFSNPSVEYYLYIVDPSNNIKLDSPMGFNEFNINTATPIPIQINLPPAPSDVRLWTPSDNSDPTYPIIVTWKDNSNSVAPVTDWYYGDPALNVVPIPSTTGAALPQNELLTSVQPAPDLGPNYYRAIIPTGGPNKPKDVCIQGEGLGGMTLCVNGVNQNNAGATPSYRIYSLAQDPQLPRTVPTFNEIIVSWSTGANPVTVEYCAEESGSGSCLSDSLGAEWSGLFTDTFSGLYANANYLFNIYARNSDGVLTSPVSIDDYTLAKWPQTAENDNGFIKTATSAKIKWDDGAVSGLGELGNIPGTLYNVHEREVTPASTLNTLVPSGIQLPVTAPLVDIVSPVSKPDVFESSDGLSVVFSDLNCATHYSFDIKALQLKTGTETLLASAPTDVYTLPTYTNGTSDQPAGQYTSETVWTFRVNACVDHFHYVFGETDSLSQEVLTESDRVIQYSPTNSTTPECWYDTGTSFDRPLNGNIVIKCSIGDTSVAGTGEWSLILLPHNNCVSASLGGGASDCQGDTGTHEGTSLGEDVPYTIVGGLLDFIPPVSDIDDTYLTGYVSSDVSIPVDDCDDGTGGTTLPGGLGTVAGTCALNSEAPVQCQYKIIDGINDKGWTNRSCDIPFKVTVGSSGDCTVQTPLDAPVGTCQVQVRSKDKAGTFSLPDTVSLRIDYEAPSVQDLDSLLIENRWYTNYDVNNQPPSVALGCSDSGSGSLACNPTAPQGIEYCIVENHQNDGSCQSGVNIFSYSAGTEASFNPSTTTGNLCKFTVGDPSNTGNMHCQFKMYVRASDPAGNIGDWTLVNFNAQAGNPSLNIDNYVPLGEIELSGVDTYVDANNKARLKVPAIVKDDKDSRNVLGSGIQKYRFTIVEENDEVEQTSSVYDGTHPPNSLRTVKVQYIDNVDNIGGSSLTTGSVLKRLIAVRGTASTQTNNPDNPNVIDISLMNDENDNAVEYAIWTTKGYITPAGLIQQDPFYAAKPSWTGTRQLTDLNPNNRYEFRVFTKNSDGIVTTGDMTDKYTRAAQVDSPGGNNLGSSAKLLWSDATDQGQNPPETRHKIFRYDSVPGLLGGGQWVLIADDVIGEEFYDDSVTCVNCNTLTYGVQSKNEDNETTSSHEFTIDRPFNFTLNTYNDLRGLTLPARGQYVTILDEINIEIDNSTTSTINDGIDRPGALKLKPSTLPGTQTGYAYYVYNVGTNTRFNELNYAKSGNVELKWCEITTPTNSICPPTSFRDISEDLYGRGVVIRVKLTKDAASPDPYLYWISVPI